MTRWTIAAASLLALAACGREPTAVRAPAAPRHTLTPLSVTITGPSQVRVNSLCSWGAGVGGGTPPFEYSWVGLNGSDNTEFGTGSWSSIGNKAISVSVSDADGNVAYAQKGINVSSNLSVPAC